MLGNLYAKLHRHRLRILPRRRPFSRLTLDPTPRRPPRRTAAPPAKQQPSATSSQPCPKTTKSSSSPVTRSTPQPRPNFGPSSPGLSMTAYSVTPPLDRKSSTPSAASRKSTAASPTPAPPISLCRKTKNRKTIPAIFNKTKATPLSGFLSFARASRLVPTQVRAVLCASSFKSEKLVDAR